MVDDAKQPVVPLHRMRVYNPGRMTDQEIESIFVARHDVLQRILNDLNGEKPTSRPQHHLIVGQRGMGKTLLLLRLAAALRSDEYRDRFIPLIFAEEQYSVDRLSKFWLNCLDSLADSCEREGLTDESDQIDKLVSRIDRSEGASAADDKNAARAALEAFLKVAKQLQRRPVLLVDNLQIVFAKTAEQQHEFRETLTSKGAPILVAASPQLPPDLNEYGFAFYDQFKTHYLRSLTLSGMRDVILSLADRSGRADIRRHVMQHAGRLQALHQLTGGNPRTTVLLFHLYAEDCSPSVSDDLEKLLDDVTALYKARFEEFSDQQQVVISEMAEYWDPIDSRTLGQMTGLTSDKLSGQLDRLVKTGVVEKVELFGTKRRGYQLAERFFNVWFLMRHASRRQRRQITFLTRFLETLYEPAERERFARQWISQRSPSNDRVLMSFAVAETLSDSPLKYDLTRNAQLAALEQKRRDASQLVERLIDFSKIPLEVVEFDRLRNRLTANFGEELATRILSDQRMFLSGRRDQLTAVIDPTPEQREAIEQELEANLSADAEEFGKDAVAWFAARLNSGQLCNVFDATAWTHALSAAEDEPSVGIVVDVLPEAVSTQIDPFVRDRAVKILSEVAITKAWQWFNHGWRLHTKLHHFTEAEEAYRNAIKLDPEFARPWNNLGNLLRNHLSRYTEVEEAYRNAIKLDPEFAWPWHNLGILLQYHVSRYTEAEEAYREAIKLDPKDAWPWIGLGNLCCDFLGRFEDADAAFANAMEFDETLLSAMLNRIFLLRDFLGDTASAKEIFDNLPEKHEGKFADTQRLHQSLFAAYEQNRGIAAEFLGQALDLVTGGLPITTTDDWIRAAAVFLQLDLGTWLAEILESRGDHLRLRPFYEAIRAQTIGDRKALLNVAVEVRISAEWFFDQIQQRRTLLAQAKKRQS